MQSSNIVFIIPVGLVGRCASDVQPSLISNKLRLDNNFHRQFESKLNQMSTIKYCYLLHCTTLYLVASNF